MTKLEALKILIEHSFFLPDELKQKLLLKMHEMDENQIDALGKFLAEEKKLALKNAQKNIEEYEKILAQLETNN